MKRAAPTRCAWMATIYIGKTTESEMPDAWVTVLFEYHAYDAVPSTQRLISGNISVTISCLLMASPRQANKKMPHNAKL